MSHIVMSGSPPNRHGSVSSGPVSRWWTRISEVTTPSSGSDAPADRGVRYQSPGFRARGSGPGVRCPVEGGEGVERQVVRTATISRSRVRATDPPTSCSWFPPKSSTIRPLTSSTTPSEVAGAAPGDFWGGVVVGFQSMTAFFGGLLVVFGVLLPWLLPLGLLAILVVWLVRRKRSPGAPFGPTGFPGRACRRARHSPRTRCRQRIARRRTREPRLTATPV
jgi:hypothetical protein